MVLACDFDRDGDFVGWWEAVALAHAEGTSFTLGWRAYPEHRDRCGAGGPSSRRCTRETRRPTQQAWQT